MARGGSGGGSKGGAQTVPYGRGGVGNNRYQPPQQQQQPVMTSGPAILPIQPQQQPSFGSGYNSIMNDMRANRGYQGLPQQRAFQQPQPFRRPTYGQMYQGNFGGYNQPQYQPMPFRAPSPGKGGSKGGGMSVPRYPVGPGGADPNLFRNEVQPYRMPIQENPLGNRGSGMFQAQPMPLPYQTQNMGGYSPRPAISRIPQQATLQGLGGFFT